MLDTTADLAGETPTADDARADPLCRCQNCEWTGPQTDLANPFAWMADLDQRVSANEITPAGECPECGAFAHRDMTAGERHNLLRQLVAAGLTLGDVAQCLGVERDADDAAVKAVKQFADDDIQFDDRVFLSEADDGCWVSCWAWVAIGPSTTPDDTAAAVR